jgi:AcrR family transcriptional regulator
MPRIAGQIDLSKNEAILDAALEVMSERGLFASLEEIARRAGVSKQTIYNHYGSRAELMRALSERRVAEITAALVTPGAEAFPERALADYGRALLGLLLRPRTIGLMRLAAAAAGESSDLSRAMYEHGTKASRARLARFLEREHAAGRLEVPNPMAAAEMFGGMVVGSLQTAFMLGAVTEITEAEIDEIAREAARRFMRAFAPA